ncbi:penicillin acylase family protein [Candidatus Hydrogenedentota bacterium]
MASKSIAVGGVKGKVEIRRDKWGIPAVFAENNQDLYFGWGYCCAEDRLFQMQMNRLSAWGRMAEFMGEKFVERDIKSRKMRTNTEVLRKSKALESYYRELLGAYAEGVNAYMDNHDISARVGFKELGFTPAPWSVEDVVACSEAIGHFEGFGHNGYKLVEKVGLEMARDCFPDWPDDTPTIVSEEEMARNKKVYEKLKGLDLPKPRRPATVREKSATGSNNCLVTGSKSATGKPILVGDPQQEPRIPNTFHEIILHGGDFHCRGAAFSGAPGILVGFNRYCAWAATGLGTDRTDFYEEKVNPDNPDQYLYKDVWYSFEKHTEVIKVKDGEDVTLELKASHHGPIVGELFDEPDRTIAMRHNMFESNDTAVLGMMRVNVAKNYEEFRDGISKWECLGANIIYADVEGNTAYWPTALVPFRPNGRYWGPVPGWTGEYEWDGYIPFEEKPSLHNPKQDFIVTANNLIVSGWYPYAFIDRPGTGTRFMALREAVMEDGAHDLDDMMDLRHSIKCNPDTRQFLPMLLEAMENRPDDVTDEMKEVVEMFKEWDFMYRKDSVTATIFDRFVRAAPPIAVKQHLGDDANLGGANMCRLPADSVWYDDPATPEVETRDDVLMKAFKLSLEELNEELGTDKSKWLWSSINKTQILDQFRQLGLDDRVDVPDLGDFVMEGSRALTAHILMFQSYSQVVDLSNIDNTRAIISIGNSEQYDDPHSQDQIDMWQNWEMRPACLSEERVRDASEETAVLTKK